MKLGKMELEGLAIGPGRDEDNRRFGKLLGSLRKAARLSINEAAAALRVTPAYMRLIERGERSPALATAPQLLALFGANFDTEVRLGDGPRADLVVEDPLRPGHGYLIEFVSRVKARRTDARSDVEQQLARLLQSAGVPVPDADEPSPSEWDAMLGRIARRLPDLNWQTLRQVEVMLDEAPHHGKRRDNQ